MASAFKPNAKTYVANGAINPLGFVKLDTTSPASAKNPRVVVCESGQAIGIAQNDVAAALGDEVEVALLGGGAKVKAGGSISAGNTLKPTTGGVAIVCASAGDHVGARAMEDGSSGDIIGAHVEHFEKYNADAT